MGKPVEKKRKKKGRPSLLDLQKRSLRLQKQQEQQQQQKKRNANPSANPYLRFSASATPIRRSTRRELPEAEVGGDDAEDEDEGSGKRREKKLRLVLRLHQDEDGGRALNSQRKHGNSDSSGSESKGTGAPVRSRKIESVGGDGSGLEKTERQHVAAKASEGEPSASGPTTPLPDKTLLVFILDRLQKKDTYGVFSEPVDPDELPDYHEIIEHPMDFGTVRKRLSNGYYKELETFEKDVFLICSNAMSYNAPDTIYFRQARSIQELAKKNFENLRQDSDEDEPEPRATKRGRQPCKTITKRTVGRPSDRATSDFSSVATLANAGDSVAWSNFHDLSKKGFTSDKQGSLDALSRTHNRLHGESSFWMVQKQDRNEDTGSVKGTSIRSGRKTFVLDENRRNTYKQPHSYTCWPESSVLTTFDGVRKQLLPVSMTPLCCKILSSDINAIAIADPPQFLSAVVTSVSKISQVGLHRDHAYARSLARFAANLGPLGWEMVAKQIEQVLPPGTKYGRGWVVEPDAPQQFPTPSLPASPPHPSPPPPAAAPSSSTASKGASMSVQPEAPPNSLQNSSTSAASSATLNGPPDPKQSAEPAARDPNVDGGLDFRRRPPPFQNAATVHLHPGGMNGFKPTFGFDIRQGGKAAGPVQPTRHARAPGVVAPGGNSGSDHRPETVHPRPARPKPAVPGTAHSQERKVGVWKGLPLPLPLQPKPESAPPPDLNLRFQSPGSPLSGVAIDSQQPDLALQL